MSNQQQFSGALLGLACFFTTCAHSAEPKPSLPFNSEAVFRYCERYCKSGNLCPSGEYKRGSPNTDGKKGTDCTHFLAHALHAGGVRVPGKGHAACLSGLAIRVGDLHSWLDDAVQIYANVKRLDNWTDAKRGDIALLNRGIAGIEIISDYHAVILADKPIESGCKIYGHQNSRCGDFAEFNVPLSDIFRITNDIPQLITPARVKLLTLKPIDEDKYSERVGDFLTCIIEQTPNRVLGKAGVLTPGKIAVYRSRLDGLDRVEARLALQRLSSPRLFREWFQKTLPKLWNTTALAQTKGTH